MRGFAEWPAVVTEIERNLIAVRFFGDYTTHRTTLSYLYSFKDSHKLILTTLKRLKNPSFVKAVKEAETVLQIPAEKSIFIKYTKYNC